MAVKIRLSRAGAKKRPHYRVVVADARSPRDGRFLERVGIYDPLLPKDHPDRVKLDLDRIKYWLDNGAKPTTRVSRFLGDAEVIPVARRDNPKKGKPKAKAQARHEAQAAAEPQAPAGEAATPSPEAAEPQAPASEAAAPSPEAAAGQEDSTGEAESEKPDGGAEAKNEES